MAELLNRAVSFWPLSTSAGMVRVWRESFWVEIKPGVIVGFFLQADCLIWGGGGRRAGVA
jgi:hypothetical protein